MEFFAYSREHSDREDTKKFKILTEQKGFTYKPEYWFGLYKNNKIIAECEVNLFNPFWLCNKIKERYEITDVLVHPPYRGNGYCSLLLLNVMYYFDQRTENPENLCFRLWAHRSNLSARRAYRKIFGSELDTTYQYNVHKLVRFST